jgi:hypothetical protein
MSPQPAQRNGALDPGTEVIARAACRPELTVAKSDGRSPGEACGSGFLRQIKNSSSPRV